MAGVVGVKRERSEISTQSLFANILVLTKILSYLPINNLFQSRSVCKNFQAYTYNAIIEQLQRRKTLTAEDICALHLPMYQLMINEVEEFQQAETTIESLRDKIWKEFSIAEISAYIIFHCPNLEFLDLCHDRFCLNTLLGNKEEIPFEVATLEVTDDDFEISRSQISKIPTDMQDLFEEKYKTKKTLPSLKTLQINAEKEIPWDLCKSAFPNLTKIIMVKGSHKKSELSALFKKFPHLEIISLENGQIEEDIWISGKEILITKQQLVKTKHFATMGSLCVDLP